MNASPVVLAIDIGGTNVKVITNNGTERRRFPSGPELTPTQMVAGVVEVTQDWSFEVVAIGVPAPVRNGNVVREPANLGVGWKDFDFVAAFGKPTKVVNDAALQALGSYEGGKMLFLGLGTGLGSALVLGRTLIPMELGHLPFRRKTFEDYVGERGRVKLGKKRWRAAVHETVAALTAAIEPDYVVLGGGNADKVGELPSNTKLGANTNAFVGAFRLWEDGAPDFEG